MAVRTASVQLQYLQRRNYSVLLEKHKLRDTSYSVAVLKLSNPPVNGLNLELVAGLSSKLSEVNDSESIHGVVIASNIPRVFSAGLELKELYEPDTKKLRALWTNLQDTWLKLYTSPHPVIAAINGHCLAGGTILAASSDYRVGVHGDYKLGVTAAKIGVVAPPWFQKTLVHVVGHRQTELMLTQAKMFTPNEALGAGLLDEVCNDEDIVSYCISSLKPLMETNPASRRLMKLQLREGLINEFLADREEDTEAFLAFILQPSVQKLLGEYIQKLKNNS